MSHINEQKLKAFQVGRMNVSQKKTPYELEKDKRERRKKEEEAAAAKVFEEFVENFQQEENDGYTSKTFVRGSTINPSAVYNPNEGASSQDQAPSFYTLKSAKPVAQEPKPPTRPTTGKKSKEPKKLSNLEMFKEQLKKEQEERELRKAMRAGDPNAPKLGPSGPPLDSIYGRPEEKPGSRADGDMSTTNIYVGNLAATANEEMLCRIFGKYGPLASVKIMWPMTPEERARGRNPAFVAFMNREDAMDAMHALNNTEIEEQRIIMGWGKSMPIPPVPFYVHSKEAELAITASGLPFNAQVRKRNIDNSKPKPARYNNVAVPASLLMDSSIDGDPKNMQRERQSSGKEKEGLSTTGDSLKDAEVMIIIPEDITLRRRIHRMVQYVAIYGNDFEALIMQREFQNPDFEFLYEYNSKEHIYYRWKMFTILQGESPNDWSKSRFRMYKDGSWWVPPMEELEEEEVKGQLKGKDRDTLEEYLRNADLTNSYVRNVMGFCLEHSAAAEEIVEVLTDSLSIPQTPIPTKIARLYIVSDVLHNTTVKGASFFRSSFESQLPGIMSQLNMALNSITGRIRAEYFKKRVLNVIAAWERWSLYPYTYLNTLKEKFLYIPPRPEDSSAPLSEVASTDAVHESRQSKDDLVSPASMQEPNTAEPQRLHSLIPPKAATKAGFKPIGFRPIGNSSTTDTEPTSTRAQKRAADDTPEEPEKKVRIQSKWE